MKKGLTWETPIKCNVCCDFGTYDKTQVGEIIYDKNPNGMPLKRVLQFLQMINGEPLCIKCIRKLKTKNTNKLP